MPPPTYPRTVRTLLLGSLCLVVLANAFFYWRYFHASLHVGSDRFPAGPLLVLILFLGLLRASARGRYRLAAIGLVSAFAVAGLLALAQWGADLSEGLLMLTIVVLLAGILLGRRTSWLAAAAVGVSLLLLTAAHLHGWLAVDRRWREEGEDLAGSLVYVVTFLIISTIARLFSQEVERSQAELQAERDGLELRVRQRAEELERLQIQRSQESERFTVLGRQISGLFHDLASPLSALGMHLAHLAELSNGDPKELADIREGISHSLGSVQQLERQVLAVRRQLQQEATAASFEPAEETRRALESLGYRLRRAGVQLHADLAELRLEGVPSAWYRLSVNLIANAVDALEELPSGVRRELRISLRRRADQVIFSVADSGPGIAPALQAKVFRPFFTTKGEAGSGLGLPLCREIVEQGFGGSVSLRSGRDGTAVTVSVPLREALRPGE